MTKEEWRKEFNAYLEMAISQGWSDPIGFAQRRMKELERQTQTLDHQRDIPER